MHVYNDNRTLSSRVYRFIVIHVSYHTSMLSCIHHDFKIYLLGAEKMKKLLQKLPYSYEWYLRYKLWQITATLLFILTLELATIIAFLLL